MLVWIKVGQGPTVLAEGVGGDFVDIFFFRLSCFSFLSLSGRWLEID